MQESKLQVSLPSQATIKSPENLPQSSWMKLINQIVRPPRSKFPQSLFGASWFVMNQTCYQRKDVILKHKGKNIGVSIFEPSQRNMWVILYLHGNSASKLESLTIIRHLPKQVSMACFDFLGCGFNYESDFVSLGVREAEQVETVVSYLELLGYQVILWGRSMGASTALKFGKSSIIVADSAFVSFESLCKEIAKQKSPCYLPNFLISCLFPCFYYRLRRDIGQLAQFDIEQVDTSQDLKKLPPETLVIFLAGNQDSLVGKHHSEQLFKQFDGDRKYLELFQGTHNSTRPKEVLSKVMGYIADFIQQKDGSYKYQFLRIKSKQSSFTADQSFVFSQHD